jgi:uncharacterized protein YidB (DUF937 family)
LQEVSHRAISPDQLRAALGEENVQQMAQQAGLPLDQLFSMLSAHLPQTIDRASPDGALDQARFGTAPDDGSLSDQAGLGDIGR